MKRADYLAYLARMVKRGKLTEQQAAQLLRDFDAGKVDGADLPLPLDEAITDIGPDDVKRAFTLLAGLDV